MTISPAGPERDKQIAKLREDEGDCGSMEKCRWDKSVCDNCIPKPYSTDISCAMELWEEMVQAGLIVYISESKDGAICTASEQVEVQSHTYGTIERGEHMAEEKADAISGAYLKWGKA
jgi:hypothetical protein